MVVVAVIGILGAVAIPNFKKYQAKSKTAEAKILLASLYTLQIDFAAEYDTYATCLSKMFDGYSIQSQYYYVAFRGASITACNNAVNNGHPDCNTACGTTRYAQPTKAVGNKLAGVLFNNFGYVVVFSTSLGFYRKLLVPGDTSHWKYSGLFLPLIG